MSHLIHIPQHSHSRLTFTEHISNSVVCVMLCAESRAHLIGVLCNVRQPLVAIVSKHYSALFTFAGK